MSERRLVVEHPDGRRVSVLEGQLDDPAANPFNVASDVHELLPGGETIIRRRAARPDADHVSLQGEGFVAVGYIHPARHTDACEDGCGANEGNELALPAKRRAR